MPVVLGRKNLYRVDKKDGRLKVLGSVFFLLAFIIVCRLFFLQVHNHDFYISLSERRSDISRELRPVRGSIYVKENEKLYHIVTNKDYFTLFADPREIENVSRVVDTLTPLLSFEEEEWKDLAKKLSKKNDPYEQIKKKIPKEVIDKIDEENLKGIHSISETYRYYTETDFKGQLTGFLGFDKDERVGQYGLEGHFNKELSGTVGYLESVKDASGLPVTVGKRSLVKPVNGNDLVLTIDLTVQLKVCEIIKNSVQAFEASGGTVIVQNPKTGAIIAMCSVPDFDPEKYNAVESVSLYNNPAIFNAYEPGSVFKAITMAAGLDLGVVEPKTTYEDTGEVKLIGRKPIRNSDLQAHGKQTMVEVLEKSLNTGAVFVVEKIGKSNFQKYVKDFGFGELSGIELDFESAGNISSLEKRGQIYTLTASFGQGITATPLQLVNAFSAIANGGSLMKPYIVDEILLDGVVVQKTSPTVLRQVLNTRAAALIHGMLVSVVENGHGKKAGVDGYYIAGKTGTAQLSNNSGEYGEDTIHTFIGYGPSSDVEFTILVKFERPQAVRFSSDSAAPIFGQIAQFLTQYYQIPPDKK